MIHNKYSTVQCGSLWKLVKKCDATHEACFVNMASSFTASLVVDQNLYRQGVLDWSALWFWKYRPMEHYFLDEGVAGFCVESVKELNHDFCKALPSCSNVDCPLGQNKHHGFFPENDDGTVIGAFAIHFPAKERVRSLIVIPEFYALAGSTKGRPIFNTCWFAGTDFEDQIFANRDNNEVISRSAPHRWLAHLIFGLSLYIDAFPDAVQPSTFDQQSSSKTALGTRFIVSRNEVIESEQRCSVSPHYRRGHFVLLQSAKYVKKQGMTIFRKGTFVHGKAFDVLSDTPNS